MRHHGEGMNAQGGVAFSGCGRVNGQTDNASAKGDDELWGEVELDGAYVGIKNRRERERKIVYNC